VRYSDFTRIPLGILAVRADSSESVRTRWGSVKYSPCGTLCVKADVITGDFGYLRVPCVMLCVKADMSAVDLGYLKVHQSPIPRCV
jgi:hypothetical protein